MASATGFDNYPRGETGITMKSAAGAKLPIASARELTVRFDFGLRDRIAGFMSLVRPVFFILTPLNAAGAAVLSLGGYPSLAKCFLGFIAVAAASVAVNVFNDYTDRERDRSIWPARALPSGRVRPGEALLLVVISLAVSLSITWLAFNPPTFYILMLALVLGGLYSIYLRDRLGYLSLPPIVGLIYLGGWAAFSPETMFNSWLPWYIYMFGVVWQTAHIMIYYPMHVISGVKNPPALFFRPSPHAAVKTGVGFTLLTLLLSGLLPLLAPDLGVLYLVLVIATGVYAMFSGLKLYKNVLDRKRGMAAFTSLSVFRLIISAAILITFFPA
jgi:4-hydroxybenzoate polyprenyltransferase